jgi:hypothetical protein
MQEVSSRRVTVGKQGSHRHKNGVLTSESVLRLALTRFEAIGSLPLAPKLIEPSDTLLYPPVCQTHKEWGQIEQGCQQ